MCERLSNLQATYDFISYKIRKELNHPLPNGGLIRELRRRQLCLREKIISLIP